MIVKIIDQKVNHYKQDLNLLNLVLVQILFMFFLFENHLMQMNFYHANGKKYGNPQVDDRIAIFPTRHLDEDKKCSIIDGRKCF